MDGRYPDARLQHPLGVAFADGLVYVADSYNHKIKRYHPAEEVLTSFLGIGKPGYRDGGHTAAQFDEPGGLTVVGGTLFIADTNNHQIRAADLATGRVRTLPIAETPPADTAPRDAPRLDAQTAAPGDSLLTLDIALPDGFAPNDLNTGVVSALSADAAVARPTTNGPHPIAYPTTLPFTFAEGETEITLDGVVYYCDKVNGRCLLEPVMLRLPLRVKAGGGEAVVRLLIASPV